MQNNLKIKNIQKCDKSDISKILVKITERQNILIIHFIWYMHICEVYNDLKVISRKDRKIEN